MSTRIASVVSVDCPVVPYDWAFANEQATEIDAHWATLCTESPALYDGRVLLSHRLHVEGDVLVGVCFETAYRNFISWRDFGFPGQRVANCFAMPALRSADGAFMLGEMSPGTANAGKLYFPAGTPEPADIGPDGRVDFEGSILRELEEETGLAPNEIALDARWTIVFAPRPVVACMRVARSSLSAATLQERLAAHNEMIRAPELVRLVAVRSPEDLDPTTMPDFMLSYLAYALA